MCQQSRPDSSHILRDTCWCVRLIPQPLQYFIVSNPQSAHKGKASTKWLFKGNPPLNQPYPKSGPGPNKGHCFNVVSSFSLKVNLLEKRVVCFEIFLTVIYPLMISMFTSGQCLCFYFFHFGIFCFLNIDNRLFGFLPNLYSLFLF